MAHFMAYIRIRDRDFAFRVNDESEARNIAEFLKKKHRAITYELRMSPVQGGGLVGTLQKSRVAVIEEPSPQQPVEPYRVLIVEDEDDLREVLVEAFEQRGCKVFSAQNARTAQMLAQTAKPDLVLSDVKMPGGDGIELFEALKKMSAIPPAFVFMTAYEDERTQKTVEENHLILFRKPFDMMDMINQTLEASQKRKKAA
jgi:two-component system response regulator (stage 0 sporulation protein F)